MTYVIYHPLTFKFWMVGSMNLGSDLSKAKRFDSAADAVSFLNSVNANLSNYVIRDIKEFERDKSDNPHGNG